MNPDNKPLAPQGAVVIVTQASPAEVDKRIRQASSSRNPSAFYEGGADSENFRIVRHDILLGKAHTVHMGSSGQKSYETVISSWNGVSKELKRNPIDLADDYYFAGISLTDFDPAKKSGPMTALATLVAGPVQIRMNADANIYAGDTVRWTAPSFNPRQRKKKRFVGQPPNKLHTVIKRLDWNDLRKVSQVTFLNAIDTRVAKMAHITSTDRGLTGDERRALAFSKHISMTAMQAIDMLARQGLLVIVTPEVQARSKKIMDKLPDTDKNKSLWTLLQGAQLLDGQQNDNDITKTDPNIGQNVRFSINGANTDQDYFQDPAIYQQGGLIPGLANSPSGVVKSRNNAIDRASLWLSVRTGAITSSNMATREIAERAASTRKRLLKKTNHIYVPPNELQRYSPNFSGFDRDASTQIVKEYIQCARDSVIEHEQMQAEHKSTIGKTAIGVCMSSASADARDPKLDLLVGFPGGNIVV